VKPYPKYKDSEVEWIGEVPAHWEILAIFRQFLSMAKGSAAEARSQLYVALDSGYLEEADFRTLYELA